MTKPNPWALAGLSLSMLLSSLGTSIANVALPTLAQSFDASFQQVQWIVVAYLLAVTTLVVGAGRLGDAVGRRRLLLWGIVLYTLASLSCGLAPSLWLLVAARVVQGLGAAAMMALAMALAAETVPKEKTGSAMGLLGTVSAVGTALGPTLGGVLIAGFGWRAIFLVSIPLGVAALVLVHRHLAPDRMQPASAGGAAPLVPLALLRDRVLGAGLAMSALVSTVMMATLVIGPFYLSQALGLETALVGLAMSAGPLVAAFCGLPAGRLVDRFGPQRVTVAGLAAVMVGCLALAVLPATLGVAGYIAPIALVTAGYAGFQAANNTGVLVAAGPERKGVVSGLLNLSRNLGLVTGASAMGAVFALASAAGGTAAARPAELAHGMRMSFGLAAVLVAAALAIALASLSASRRSRLRALPRAAAEAEGVGQFH